MFVSMTASEMRNLPWQLQSQGNRKKLICTTPIWTSWGAWGWHFEHHIRLQPPVSLWVEYPSFKRALLFVHCCFFFRVVKINAGSWTCQVRQSLLPFHKTLHYTEWHKQMTRFLDINSHWRILHLLHPLNVIGVECAQTRVRKDKRKTKSIWACLKVKVKNRSNGVSSFLPFKWPFKWYRNDKSMYILI